VLREDKEIIKLTLKDFISAVAGSGITFYSFFEHSRVRKSLNELIKENNADRADLRQKIYYLKKRKLINVLVKGKDKYIELTRKGKEKYIWSEISAKKEWPIWDKKFRMIIFDIPEEKKTTREIIRNKLLEIGFELLQKSVFVFPFDCKGEIDALCYFTNSHKYIKYIIAEIVQGEEDIIQRFLDKGILKERDIKS